MIGLSVVNWLMREDGWTFAPGRGVVADPIHGAQFLRAIHDANVERWARPAVAA